MDNDDDPLVPPPHPKKLKYLTTFAILFGNITFGCTFNFFSPALQDLKTRFDTTVEGISYVFTIMLILYCVGGLTAGIVYNYINRQLGVTICLGFMALALLATPHVPTQTMFFVVGGVMGFFCGGYDTAQMVWMMELWQGEAGVFIQAQNFCYALGSNLPPLLIGPFLSDDNHNSNSTTPSPPSFWTDPEKSKIFIPFTIGGAFSLLACCYQLFLFIFFRYYKPASVVDLHVPKDSDEDEAGSDEGQVERVGDMTDSKEDLSTLIEIQGRGIYWYKVKLIGLTAMFLSVYAAMEISTLQFIPTFAKYSDLKLSDSDAAFVLTGTTVTFAVGRAIGIFIILKVIPQHIVCGNLVLIVIGNLIILMWASENLTMLWVGCTILGAGFSTVYPSFCAYMESHLLFTNGIGAFLIVCQSAIAALYPLIVGRAIEANPEVLTYTNFFSITMCIIALSYSSKLTYKNKKRV